MKKQRKRNRERTANEKLGETVVVKPLEVTIQECNGDTTKMIKRFAKKTRKEEILKPFYRRLLYWETKSQKRRRQRLKGVYEWQKKQEKLLIEDK